MARIPLVTRDQVAENEHPAYDAFMLSRANRPNIGPYSLLLRGDGEPGEDRRPEITAQQVAEPEAEPDVRSGSRRCARAGDGLSR